MWRLQIITLLLIIQQVTLIVAFSPAISSSLTYQSRNNNIKALYMSEEAKRNSDRPELPEIPGDYDWDAKFGGDADWITERVPGKTSMNEIDLARQATSLSGLEDKWKNQRIQEEYEASINVGWVPTAELANGRFAMFFLVTGLLTELWTGVSLPGQIEELLRISGIIGFDGA